MGIRDLRKARGMTQRDVGKLSGMAAQRISDYETGFVPPKFQLTLPVWGADAMPYEPVRSPISTHAPRVGSARRFFKPVSS